MKSIQFVVVVSALALLGSACAKNGNQAVSGNSAAERLQHQVQTLRNASAGTLPAQKNYRISLTDAWLRSSRLAALPPTELYSRIAGGPDLKTQWGNLKPEDFSLDKANNAITALHINPIENISAALMGSLGNLLANAQPAFLIFPAPLAHRLKLESIDASKDADAVLVKIEDWTKAAKNLKIKLREALALEREAFEFWKKIPEEKSANAFAQIYDRLAELKVMIPIPPYDDVLAADGFARNLDAHSHLMSRADFTQVTGKGDTALVGVGLRFTLVKKGLLVRQVFEKGGADDAKIKEGDLITKIDDYVIKGETDRMSQLSPRISGPLDSKVRFQILRGDEVIDFIVTRKNVISRNVNATKLGNATLISMNGFNEDSDKDVAQLLKTAPEGSPVVFDLRDNPGGLVNTVEAMVNLFVSDPVAPIFYEKGRNGFHGEFISAKPAEFKNPLVILINGSSASASEILASNLKHFNRALLIGKTTYGKGTEQHLVDPMQNADPNKDAKLFLAITTNFYFTGFDFTPQMGGVTPHKSVETTLAKLEPEFEPVTEREMAAAFSPVEGKAPFKYTISDHLKKALDCVDAADPEIKAAFKKAEDSGREVADLQLETAKKAVECLTH